MLLTSYNEFKAIYQAKYSRSHSVKDFIVKNFDVYWLSTVWHEDLENSLELGQSLRFEDSAGICYIQLSNSERQSDY
jgi:hypothetical protein